MSALNLGQVTYQWRSAEAPLEGAGGRPPFQTHSGGWLSLKLSVLNLRLV